MAPETAPLQQEAQTMTSFNEAGAEWLRKRPTSSRSATSGSGFNEAGAEWLRKLAGTNSDGTIFDSFNEAGAEWLRKPRQGEQDKQRAAASMRPEPNGSGNRFYPH